MKPIAIYGAGSLGQEVLVMIRQINEYHPEWEPIGFFDDDPSVGDNIDGLRLLGGINDLNQYVDKLNVIVALGNPAVRKRIVNKINNPLVSYPIIIHPGVQLKPYQRCHIGEGSIIAAGNILTVGISIGRHVILNMACTVGHDVRIGDYTSIMPNCIISGGAQIGSDCFIGAGAAIMNRVEISPATRIRSREFVNFESPKILG